jgi:hypothetical protein
MDSNNNLNIITSRRGQMQVNSVAVATQTDIQQLQTEIDNIPGGDVALEQAIGVPEVGTFESPVITMNKGGVLTINDATNANSANIFVDTDGYLEMGTSNITSGIWLNSILGTSNNIDLYGSQLQLNGDVTMSIYNDNGSGVGTFVGCPSYAFDNDIFIQGNPTGVQAQLTALEGSIGYTPQYAYSFCTAPTSTSGLAPNYPQILQYMGTFTQDNSSGLTCSGGGIIFTNVSGSPMVVKAQIDISVSTDASAVGTVYWFLNSDASALGISTNMSTTGKPYTMTLSKVFTLNNGDYLWPFIASDTSATFTIPYMSLNVVRVG